MDEWRRGGRRRGFCVGQEKQSPTLTQRLLLLVSLIASFIRRLEEIQYSVDSESCSCSHQVRDKNPEFNVRRKK